MKKVIISLICTLLTSVTLYGADQAAGGGASSSSSSIAQQEEMPREHSSDPKGKGKAKNQAETDLETEAPPKNDTITDADKRMEKILLALSEQGRAINDMGILSFLQEHINKIAPSKDTELIASLAQRSEDNPLLTLNQFKFCLNSLKEAPRPDSVALSVTSDPLERSTSLSWENLKTYICTATLSGCVLAAVTKAILVYRDKN